MPVKKRSGSTVWTDPDDALELTAGMLARAEVFEGDRFARRGPGRPRAEVTKEKISVRLDPDVLARLRESGPGWQSRINTVLRMALGLEGDMVGGQRPGSGATALRTRRVGRRHVG
ncbi:MAG TPA: BrnA antitoxin family protein [Acetobacteraceae bacterium]|nr:BrnA antitoxin family protein [Acetobacteraceae bacterium]